jgi:uncharacterized protein (TIGR02145 family)
MKNVLSILLLLNFLTLLNGQTNRLFYKSVFKQADGTPIKNMDLNVLIKISNYNGLEKYSECHLIRTDQNGYGYLWLGYGNYKSGKLENINFESEKHILKILLKDFQVYRWTDIYCTPFSKYPNLPETLNPSNIINESNIFYWGGIKLKALGIGYNNEVLSIEHDDNIDDKAYNDEIKAGKSFIEKLSDEEVIIKSSTILKNYLQKGFVFDLLPQPNLLYSKSISTPNSDINTFQSKIGNLEFNKIYYIRSYITYENDTIYGETAKFQLDKKINVQLPCPNVPKIFDIDGNSYNTVQIGNQCWTKENLKVTKFRDGSLIQIDESGGVTGSTTGQTWTSQTIGKRTIYANDKTKLSVYGYLYNWFVVSDSRGICPSGWHVPEREELSLLINFLGGEKTAGSKLKEKSSTLWQNSNLENSNESGFSGIPGGIRGIIQGGYSGIGSKGVWWSSTKYDKDDAYKMELTNNSNDAKVGVTSMLNGFSIRCVKDNLKNSNDSIPKISTIQITDVTSNSAQSGGSISSEGGSEIIAKGVVWSRSKRPDILTDSTTREGKGIGTFSSELSDLISGKKYFVRAYATSNYGTSYGQELSFKTLTSDKLPKVETSIINDITQKSAFSGGKILNDGDLDIITKGVVWSKNPNPKLWLFANKTEDGNGNENYISIIDKLSPFETYYVRAYATNSAGIGYGNELTFKTTPAAVVPTLTTISVSSITSKSAISGGNISSDGGTNVTAKGLVWSISLNPTVILSTKTTNGNGTGNFTSDMIDLLANTTYYVRAYATNSAGTGYGNEVSFKTTPASVVPTLTTTTAVSSITSKTAVSGGNISSDGGLNVTTRGVVWSTNPNPTVTLTTKTTNGNGIGSFTSDMIDLLANTTYYVRAYATNSAGTGYGNELTFKTTLAAVVPTLTTTAISSMTSNTAVSGGNISTDGGSNVTARGVVWSTNSNPTIALTTKTSNGSGTGSFSSTLTNLTPKTTYYVRAYATNSTGTGYGNEITFITSDSTNVMGIPCPGTTTVKDIDGNTYNTVQIGTQCWTKENLRVTKYRDGSDIPLDESGGTAGNGTGQTWSSRTIGARTVYGHNAANLSTYGYLYNWHSVTDTKGLCPTGWNVPSEAEWKSLGEYLGTKAGIKLADTSWILATEKATNESGFSVKPGGYRDTSGRFSPPLTSGNFWSTSYDNNFTANPYIGTELYLKGYWGLYAYNAKSGVSVRCIKLPDSIISMPVLSTTLITSISSNSVISGGTIYSDGGSSVTSRGVVWAINPAPTIALSTKTADYFGTGTYRSSIINLKPNTTYYLRAYATNKIGTTYGNELIFNTQDSIMNIPCPGYSTVKDIDGNIYNTVKIGSQCWTKENLRVTKYRNGTLIPLDDSGGTTGNGIGQAWSSKITGARTIYEHNDSNLATYGYLYNWYAATDTKGLCPSGWHVPSDNEFKNLTAFLGGVEIAGALMKTIGTTFWKIPNSPATNESGFSALPSGFRNNVFTNIGYSVGFWSTTNDIYDYSAIVISLISNGANLFSYGTGKWSGYSIRCLKDTSSTASIPTITTTGISLITTTSATSGGNITADSGAPITARGIVWSTNTKPTISLTTKTSDGTGTGSFSSSLTNLTPKTTYYVRAYATNNAGTAYGNEISFTTKSDSTSVMGIPCPGAPTVKDIDGNTYNTVQIGTQCWTKENLRVSKYRDGTIIPWDESGGTNGNGTGQTWSSRTSGARTVYAHSTSNLATYGYLYNWYAAIDKKGLCPSGWHVPFDGEWTTLTTYLGGESVAGDKMKTIGTSNWDSSSPGANNSSGFSALPGSTRSSGDGSFCCIGSSANFWSATEEDNNRAWQRFLTSIYSEAQRGKSTDKSIGASVRCLKDTLTIVSIPLLTTTAITSITITSAASGGNITSDGGSNVTARGIVWSTSTKPTISLTTKTSDGTGTGSFSSSLTNLTPKTTYYVRAYATNNAGTAYGNEITFTTKSDSTNVMGIPCPGITTVKDIDGNTYNTVQIGTQCWTKENLRVTKYRDGSVIPLDESGGPAGNGSDFTWGYSNTGSRTVYGHNTTNLATYGYLYNWYSAADTKGLCPSGWHVPSDDEWYTLTDYLGGEGVAGGKMKTIGTAYWNFPNIGATNESGFSALPGGYRLFFDGSFEDVRDAAFFWSTTENENYITEFRIFNDLNSGKLRSLPIIYSKLYGSSVRCLKDTLTMVSIPLLTTTSINAITSTTSISGGNITADGGASIIARGVVWSTSTKPTISLTTKTSDGTGTGSFSSSLTNLTPKTTFYIRAYATNSAGTGYGNEISFTTTNSSNVTGIPCPGIPTVKDIDGNTYNTDQIGTQCWTKENLRVTKYRDGSVIPLDESGGTAGNGTGQTWSSRTIGARTVYGHSATNLATYGYLYNWFAVADTKGLCPSGWHVPSDGEWTTLTTFLGGVSAAGGRIKTIGTAYWNFPNIGATNESGFSVLPGGYRLYDGSFYNIRNNAFFWSATEINYSFNAWYRFLYYNYGSVSRGGDLIIGNKSVGASVRCLRD